MVKRSAAARFCRCGIYRFVYGSLHCAADYETDQRFYQLSCTASAQADDRRSRFFFVCK
ncbi:hypothetical protein [Geobacillus thermodenitrificans]|uniref:hypothetical protein n=1 Tax=Geobacillus thermodenitrificans TaxID=33940 RepID=UPI0012F9EA03|nr:hypothetical protein [Geobacillus thermodenitrificans]